MKDYKVGEKVKFSTDEFDGKSVVMAQIIETGDGYAIAREITSGRPMILHIDKDTDFQFGKEQE